MKWHNPGHEYDDIGMLLKGKKKIVLYGMNFNAGEIISVIDGTAGMLDWEIVAVDKNRFWQDNGFRYKKVISPEAFFRSDRSDSFIVVCPEKNINSEIMGILSDHGINNKTDIIFSGEFFLYYYLSIYFSYIKKITFFTSQAILPSTVCNLNCRDCLNFTPYIKENIIDSLENVKKDIDTFFSAVDLVYRFQFSGGEPFLYPNLIDIMKYTSDKYSDKIIRLEMVTNGTIIPSDEVCAFLRDYKIYVFLDDYVESLPKKYGDNFANVKNKFDLYEIRYIDNQVTKWMRMYPISTDRSDWTDKQMMKQFDSCRNPYSTLRKGRIAKCNYAHFASKAGICGDFQEEYYDLEEYSPERRNELIEFRTGYSAKGYTEFCRYCGGWQSINNCWAPAAIQEPKK